MISDALILAIAFNIILLIVAYFAGYRALLIASSIVWVVIDILIYQELELIRRGMVINITLEELLKDLADRSHSDEMQQFAEVFVIAKRSGGNFADIINSSAEIIGRQIEMRQEVQTLLSGRQMEQTVMKLMPFGILIYISVAYPGYFDVLYHNLQGILIMTACLAVYLTAFVMSDRIVKKIV